MCGVVVRFWVVLVGSTFVEWLGSSVSGLRLVGLWFTVVSILSVPGFWVISFRVGLVAGWLCFWFMNWIWCVFGFGLWVSDFGGFRLRVLFWCCGVVDCLMVPSLGGGFGVGFPFGTLWLA